MDSLSPNIFVRDMNETIAYYKKLGFETVMTVPDKPEFVWVMMKCGSVTFMFQTFTSLGEGLPEISRQNGGSLLLYINIKNINQYFNKTKDHVNILHGLEKTFYGTMEFSVKDNNGYVLTFAEDVQA